MKGSAERRSKITRLGQLTSQFTAMEDLLKKHFENVAKFEANKAGIARQDAALRLQGAALEARLVLWRLELMLAFCGPTEP